MDTVTKRNPNTNASRAEHCGFPFTIPELIERICHGYKVADGELKYVLQWHRYRQCHVSADHKCSLDEIRQALGYRDTNDPLVVEDGNLFALGLYG